MDDEKAKVVGKMQVPWHESSQCYQTGLKVLFSFNNFTESVLDEK